MQGPLILDRYRPIEVKGEGGSGKVELCWDTRIMRRVAIKRMPISGLDDTGSIPGLAEARTAAMLNRPSIVSVFDFDATETEAFLIMEAIEGPTLAEVIADTPAGTFDLDVIASILAAVGDAVSFAHENQVLHLDIKPENILITKSGACKVSDFGIAELADAQGFGKAIGGTIGYMPPEQMQLQELDERCDEFALAMVAYEMLTGNNPFSAPTIDESLKRIAAFEIMAPSHARGDLDEGIDNVFYAALAPEREGRYSTVDSFMGALMPYLGNPAAGLSRLRDIASDNDEEAPGEEVVETSTPILQRIPSSTMAIGGRVLSAALCWWVSALGLSCIDALGVQYGYLVALLPALAGAIKAPLGTLLSMLCLGAALCINPSVPLVMGIVVIAASIIWLVLFAREGNADANCVLLVAPLGLIGFTPLAPMLAGYCLPPRRAFGAALMQVVLAFSLSCATATSSLLHFGYAITSTLNTQAVLLHSVTNPATWIIIGAWVLSAVFMSLFCSRETRLLSVIGACTAACVMIAAEAIAAWLTSGIWVLPQTDWSLATIVALVVICVISALAAPSRHKGEEQ